MGLFSFMKSAGASLGLTSATPTPEAAPDTSAADKQAAVDAARAEALVAMVQSLKLPIADLVVQVKGDVATLQGTAPDQATREKCVLICGNTVGIAQIDDQLAVEIPAPPAVFHTVVEGDTLSKISREAYGVIRLYDAIFEANRPMLEHPDAIYPGQVLRIPPVAEPVHDVQKGESLGVIAKHWYGSASRYTDIYEANTAQLSNPNAIEVGQRLIIPLFDCKPELRIS